MNDFLENGLHNVLVYAQTESYFIQSKVKKIQIALGVHIVFRYFGVWQPLGGIFMK
jgi:hypothetical protein